ncbi:MAG: M2 family metallopeptidase [Pirellulales bacterium]|nr:M2 family metallopeptidase [Pirellulales bacterium]
MQFPQSTVLCLICLIAFVGCSVIGTETGNRNDARARCFIQQYEETVEPLVIEVNRRDWDAAVSGKEEDFRKKQEAEEKLNLCLADADKFAELKSIRQSELSDPLLARQIDVLYRQYLSRQVPPELLKKIVAKENEIQRKFNVFRPKLDGREVTDNQLQRILNESRDSGELRAAWEASKQVGPMVLADLKELIALRNEAARKLGFSDFHAMQLFLGEQDREQLEKLFDELDDLTRGPFHEAKTEIDEALAERYGIAVEELRPWHYRNPFFQEAPALPGALPESVFKSLDTVETCRKFYAGIGLPVDDVLSRSDLFEKPGKNPHAFATDIDRSGDVRIFENVVPGREWMCTTMHELGHAVYSKGISRDLPFVLRNDSHPLTTEGVAMMFERFPLKVEWLLAMGAEIPDAERYRASMAKQRRNRMLVFSRWAQVMFRFEKALYADPAQDLNRLWWDLVEKYQEIKRPEGRDQPDYAAKYHIVGAPCYYHNYMLGEMFASQLHHALIEALRPGTNPAAAIYAGERSAGEFLTRKVFAPGLSLSWNELTRRATGSELSPKAFAEDIKPEPSTERM